MDSVRREFGLAFAAIVLLLYAALVVRVWLVQVDPERFVAPGSAPAALGPRPAVLDRAADARIERALEVLNDTSRPSAERLSGYRQELEGARVLLEASLHAQPAQAYTLAKLASVRWELAPAPTEAAAAGYVESIRVASEMAPRVAAVQRLLGGLLLRMGRRPDAVEYLARAVELEPDQSDAVVDTLRADLMSAERILASLPREPEPVAALYDAFREDGGLEVYAEVVDPLLAEATPRLLAVYAASRLLTGRADALHRRMAELSYRDSPMLESERVKQMSRASLALGDTASAIAEARHALAILPSDPGLAENLGDVLSRADDEEAVQQYREALVRVARGSGDAGTRARLYRKIGQAEESRGRPVAAIDAYRRAVELQPGEAVAVERLRRLTEP